MTDGKPNGCPSVWYIAAGYGAPGGIEVYLLHYATELRRQGFNTRIVVFEQLPDVEHRCLAALRERGIPIESLYHAVRARAWCRTLVLGLPWLVWWEVRGRRTEDRGRGTEDRGRRTEVGGQRSVGPREQAQVIQGSENLVASFVGNFVDKAHDKGPASRGSQRQGGRGLRAKWRAFHALQRKKCAVALLERMIARERPDVLHVKGRVITEALDVLPAARTVVHIATRGQRDPSWTDAEVAAMRDFCNRAARVFAPGTEVAANLKAEFGVTREVHVIFTMAPDEAGQGGRGLGIENSGRGGTDQDPVPHTDCPNPEPRIPNPLPHLRFGTLARLVEHKGIPETLQMLKEYRDTRGVEIPFTFAGTGPLEDYIRKFIASAALKEASLIPVTSPADALSHMDVLVLASESEAMPLAIVEAFMCGKPCIATRVGGTMDLVRDGTEGFLIDPGEPDQLLGAIMRFLLMDAGAFQAMAERARSRYEDACAPERVGSIVAEHYRAIMEAATP